MRIYTRAGDKGDTELLYGDRISKADPRCHACGTLDEATSALGLARSLCRSERVRELLLFLQRELFTVGAELATLPSKYPRLKEERQTVTPERVERLERLIDELVAEHPLERGFIIPGSSPASAALDLARTIARRAERWAVALKEAGQLPNPDLLRYLNRLSDLLYVLARYEARDAAEIQLEEP